MNDESTTPTTGIRLPANTPITMIVEPFAGTAAVTWAALGAPRFPCSRIGGKAGYAHAILREFGIESGSLRRAHLVEQDTTLATLLAGLTFPSRRKSAVKRIVGWAGKPPRALWEATRDAARSGNATLAAALVYLAGARGGVGGYKGAHKLRPSVCGFIPSLDALVRRVEAFQYLDDVRADVDVVCDDGRLVAFEHFLAPAAVYIDAPYAGRTGYGSPPVPRSDVLAVASRAAAAGHFVIVSEAEPLCLPGWRHLDITNERRGQHRRSLTRSSAEWLTIWDPRGAISLL